MEDHGAQNAKPAPDRKRCVSRERQPQTEYGTMVRATTNTNTTAAAATATTTNTTTTATTVSTATTKGNDGSWALLLLN